MFEQFDGQCVVAVAADGDSACFSLTFWTVPQPLAWCIIRPCIQYTAGVASLAGAWFTHWPVRPMCGLYGPVLPQVPSVLPHFWQLWYTVWSNKSSAVAEMGDCMATIHQHYNRHRPKVGLYKWPCTVANSQDVQTIDGKESRASCHRMAWNCLVHKKTA